MKTERVPEHARELTAEVLDERRELCGPITIYGRQAHIAGARLPFALVRHEGQEGESEVSWEAVKHWRAEGTAPPHPLELGQHLDVGTVIAFGYFTEEPEVLMSVFLLLDKEHRIPNEENYELRLWNPEVQAKVQKPHRFANLVLATRVWEDEYGMDM